MADKQPGDVFVPPKGPARGGQLNGGLVGYVPGQVIRPASDGPHRATLLKAGSDIVFQLHYTPNGKATTDQTEIGLIFGKEPPKEKLMGGNSALMRLTLPPNEDNIKLTAVSTVPVDCELVSMMPHAHLRGKSFEYSITRPDGTTEKVLSVPHYDFNWRENHLLARRADSSAQRHQRWKPDHASTTTPRTTNTIPTPIKRFTGASRPLKK